MSVVDILQKAGLDDNEGVEPSIVEEYQRRLWQNKLPNIPLGYANFLQHINGVQTSDLALFGIAGENSGFVQDIYERNLVAGVPENNKVIFLGDNFNEYLCYDWQQKSYLIINKLTKEVIKNIAFFEIAVVFFLREYLSESILTNKQK